MDIIQQLGILIAQSDCALENDVRNIWILKFGVRACVRASGCVFLCVLCSMKFDYIPIDVIKWFLHFISNLLFKVINRMVIFYDNNIILRDEPKKATVKRNFIQVDSFNQSDEQFENSTCCAS